MTNDSQGNFFSLRAGIRDLFIRPDFHEPVVDGIRALAVLWVVIFHAWFFQGPFFVPEPEAASPFFLTIRDSPYWAWLVRGHFGVDLFFVISGFLIGSILFKELERTDSLRFKRFYLRRGLRLIPVYIVAMLLGLFFLDGENAINAWANLLYVNNFLPIQDQYMGWCWSLAIEEQFYLVAPFVLVVAYRKPQHIIKGSIVLLVVGWIIRVALLQGYGFDAYWDNGTMGSDAWRSRFSAVYDNFYTRYGGLLIGLVAAWIQLRHKDRLQRFFRDQRTRATILSSVALVLFLCIAVFQTQFVNSLPEAISLLHFAIERDVLAASIAILILAALHGQFPVALTLRRILGARILYPIAQLSYSGYLMHEMLMIWGFKRYTAGLANSLGADGAFLVNLFASVFLTFFSAAILYILIERPCMRLRNHPRLTGRS
ncbi:MAG: acyltransferase [Planctomycetes bacterium]|nr:acyltransferase [Planctomycetota bacterium]MCP4770414.1 acyltransferase [Planctomycetota bacterium]MCP4860494.1 acyltransferase [Planctomycetota bacterium]